MARTDWVNLTARMPKPLHELIRDLAHNYRVSINQIMLETIVSGIAGIRLDPTDPESAYLIDDPEISTLFEAAREQITDQFLKEFEVPESALEPDEEP